MRKKDKQDKTRRALVAIKPHRHKRPGELKKTHLWDVSPKLETSLEKQRENASTLHQQSGPPRTEPDPVPLRDWELRATHKTFEKCSPHWETGKWSWDFRRANADYRRTPNLCRKSRRCRIARTRKSTTLSGLGADSTARSNETRLRSVQPSPCISWPSTSTSRAAKGKARRKPLYNVQTKKTCHSSSIQGCIWYVR